MDLFHWRDGMDEPFQEFEALQSEINRLFDLSRVPETRGIFERAYSPAVDVIESPDGFQVFCDMPGVGKDDLEIKVENNELSVIGRRQPGPEGRYSLRERPVGDYRQTYTLDETVDHSKIDAVLEKGILSITLDLKEQVKPRTIAVRGA